MEQERKKIWFIVNPKSGVGRQRKITEAIGRRLDATKYDAEIRYTAYAGHAIELATEAVRSGVDIVVAVGGDGSVNEVAQVLVNTSLSLGIIPMGSGNGLAHHLRIPLNANKALNSINQHRTIMVDTASVNDVFFVSVAGVGFDAHVAGLFAKGKRRGFLSYLRISFGEYTSYKPKKYRVIIDGVEIKRRAMMVVFANSDQFGYNTSIAPGADIADGILDVCFFGKPSLWYAPWLAWLLFTGKINRIKELEIFRGREIRVFRDKDALVNIDGEPKHISRDFWVQVNHRSLKVIVP